MVIKENTALLRKVPVIRRAREYHLYDNTGHRYLDLYLNGGRAILGHRPEGFSLILKNTLARGVYGEYPSHEEGKMLKAARALWEDNYPRICYYRKSRDILNWLKDQKLIRDDSEISDPARNDGGTVSLWRPWIDPDRQTRIILPVLPFPGMECGLLVCASSSVEETLPPGDLPSPVTAAGLARCLWSMKSLLDRTGCAPADKQAGLPGFSGWTRRGNYLLWKGDVGSYEALFDKSLAGGVVLPPDPLCPAVIPPVLTSGDLKILNKAFG